MRQDFGHALLAEETVQLPRHLIEQRRVDLVIEKVIHLQNAAGQHFAVGQDAVFKKLHGNALRYNR